MKKIICTFLALIAVMLVLVSCVPGTYRKAEKKMTKKDYIVSVDTISAPSVIAVKCDYEPSCLITAKKGEEIVYAFYFRRENDAKGALEYIQNTWAGLYLSDAEIKVKDSIIYFGIKQAVKDFE